MAHVRNAEHGRAEKAEIISTKSSPARFIAAPPFLVARSPSFFTAEKKRKFKVARRLKAAAKR